MENVTLISPAISCEHCQWSVEAVVGALPGVDRVQAIVPTKEVAVRFDPALLTKEHLKATQREAGYPVRDGAVITAPRCGSLPRAMRGEDAPGG